MDNKDEVRRGWLVPSDGGDPILPVMRSTLVTGDPKRSYPMSKDQKTTAVCIANILDAEFWAAVEYDNPPTITNSSRPSPPEFRGATHLLGELGRLAEFCREHQPESVATGLWKEEIPGLRDNVVTVQTWLEQFITHLGE